MRRVAARDQSGDMPPGSTVVRLEIVQVTPLQGELSVGDGPPHRFDGWVGLLAALGEIVDGLPGPAVPTTSRDVP